MPPLGNLGQPFGSAGRLINIPAPQQIPGEFAGLQGAANLIAQGILQRSENQKLQADLVRLGDLQRGAGKRGAGGVGPPAPPLSELLTSGGFQSRAFNNAIASGSLTRAFAQPTQAEQLKAGAELAATQAGTAKTIAETGQVGQPTPQTPALEALTRAQTAKAAAATDIIEPSTLTVDEKRKRDLIEAGIDSKTISKLEQDQIKSIIAKNRAESEKLLRASRGVLTPEQIISQGNTFRKEFDALSSDFRKIRDSHARIQEVAKDPSAAGDIAIIFNFMKMLDPGSVVRESEFATAAEAAGVPDKIRNLYNKLLTGERIAFNRPDFIKQSNNLLRSQQRTQSKLVDRYTKLSNRFGVNPANVVTDVTVISDPNTPGIAGQELQQPGLSTSEEAEFQQLLLESR